MIMARDRNPVLWTTCERCYNPVALFDHDELAYLMSIHNGVEHIECPTEHVLERILTHANPAAHTANNHALAGRPVRLVFTTERGGRAR